ncbi:hypothetical protein FB451DRAFT_1395639 [Mycena latifolia]|nr:hypothetical protein FB451DRAFT_1395639 [Mycena latifolia]
MSSQKSGRPAVSNVYYCDCPSLCKRRKKVSRATYFAHAPNRNPLGTLEAHTGVLAQLIEAEDGLDDAPPPQKKRRTETQPDLEATASQNSTSSSASGGFAAMQLSDDPSPFTVGDSDGFGKVLDEEDDTPDPGSLADPFVVDEPDDERPKTPLFTPDSPPPSPITVPQQPPDNMQPPSHENPLPPNPSIHERLSSIESVRNTQLFLRALEGATLEGSGLDEDVIDRLRNPIQECVDISDVRLDDYD